MLKIRQNSFLAGQLDFEMMGRQDFQKYQKGASVLRNFNILKRGGITKRQGFDRIVNLKETKTVGGVEVPVYTDGFGSAIDENTKIRLIPFGFKKDNGFVLMFVPGKCYALCTAKGCIFACWEILYEGGSTKWQSPIGAYDGTQNEINEFDYSQCGYKLFIAHHNHFPSVIETSESQVEYSIAQMRRIIAGENVESPSPFTWKPIELGGLDEGRPSITGALQNRIAPSADTAGGTFTEKYKASAVFDDVETKPCSEFYNESYILPVELGSTAGTNCTLVQRSTSTTAAYTTISYDAAGTTATGQNRIPKVTNTNQTWSNKVSKSCVGTKYYLPWVESQSIKLTIKAKTQGGKLPEKINVYKKHYGYYGLVGTVSLGQLDSEPSSTDIAFGTEINAANSEMVSTTDSARAYKADTALVSDDSNAKDRKGVYHSGLIPPANANVYVTAHGNVHESILRLTLGFARVNFTSFVQSGGVNKYKSPLSADFTFTRNTATSASIAVNYSYTNNGAIVTETKTLNVSDIPVSGSVTNGSFTGSTTALFKKNLESNLSSWINGDDCPAQIVYDVDLSTIPSLPQAELSINSITITPSTADGVLALCNASVFTHSDTVEFTDNNISPNSSITPIDSDFNNPFNGDGNNPSTVCISQQRLIFGSSDNQPETIWMSAIGDFGNFVEHEIQKEDDSIEFDMPVTRFAKLNHIVEMRQLIAFNSACEWLIASSSAVKGITYETIQARPQSYSGSNTRLRPLICNNSVVFSERTGQSVRRFAYSIQDDGFAGRDVSILSSSIFEKNSIVDWTYQQHPFSMIWCVLSDGSLASFTFMEEQDIMAWATHKHGGGKVKAIATSYAMSPSLDEVQDISTSDTSYELATHEEIFALVHTDDDELWIERMRIRSDQDDSVYHSLCLDSVRVLNPTNQSQPLADTRLTYIDGLTGETLTKAQANTNRLLHAVYEGYRYEAKFTSVFPIIGQVVGTGQFDIKNITNLGLRLEASCGGAVESEGKAGDKEPIRYDDEKGEDKTPIIAAGNAKFFNVNAVNVKPIGVNTRDGRVTVTQNEPYPFTIISLEIDYATEREQSYNAKQV